MAYPKSNSIKPRIALLYGGVSAEREVSLGSGAAVAASLEKRYAVDRFDVDSAAALPAGLDPERHVVFSTLHGTFGEDGGIQRLLDAAGVEYAGCDAASSALTFDKVATKRRLAEAGVPVAPDLVFRRASPPSAAEVVKALGPSVVLKPVDQGSSIGLRFAQGEAEIAEALSALAFERWLIERRVVGREATVGVVSGQAFAIVEIRPKQGAFDYRNKYTKGATEYFAPAPLDEPLARRIKDLATAAFRACGCRDYARIDLMISEEGDPVFLEVNTLPGMKETSLLPMSAAAVGYDFDDLLQKLIEPAIERHRIRYSLC